LISSAILIGQSHHHLVCHVLLYGSHFNFVSLCLSFLLKRIVSLYIHGGDFSILLQVIWLCQ